MNIERAKDIIKSNWPDDRYSELQKALAFLIDIKEREDLEYMKTKYTERR